MDNSGWWYSEDTFLIGLIMSVFLIVSAFTWMIMSRDTETAIQRMEDVKYSFLPFIIWVSFRLLYNLMT